ncbi:MAG: GGDEF domain-containing protein [Pseudomonadales bacterium]|nr:GGDEF domain-containing protein [Pseudomonadales bacterium]
MDAYVETGIVQEGESSLLEPRRRFTQRFSAEDEKAYQSFLWSTLDRHFRHALMGGAFVYLFFSVLDFFLYERQVGKAWLVRLAVGLFTLVAVALACRRVKDLAVHEAVQSVFCVLVMLTVELASLLAPSELHDLYVMGLLLSWMFSFILMRVPLRYASWLMIAGLVLHNGVAVVHWQHSPWVLLIENIALVTAALMLGAASYFLEKGSRVAYCQMREVRRQKARLEEANLRLADLSLHDALTGLDNRRSFEDRYDAEWRRAFRAQQPLGVMVIDVDAFKQYNDSCGHVAGDHCLKHVAAVIATAARRPGDIVARFGGEEFVVVWPNAAIEDLLIEARRLCEAVEALAIYHPRAAVGQSVTVSIGVACHVPSEEISARRLFECADTGLYRAKRMGRNQVELEVIADAEFMVRMGELGA